MEVEGAAQRWLCCWRSDALPQRPSLAASVSPFAALQVEAVCSAPSRIPASHAGVLPAPLLPGSRGFSAAPHCLLSSLHQPFAIANPVCFSPARGLAKRCRCCCPTVSPPCAETSFPIPAASIKIFQRCLRDQTSCRWVTDCHGSAGLSPSRGDSLLVPVMEGDSSKVASPCGDGSGM